jgi:quinol monooxygenase YgiN
VYTFHTVDDDPDIVVSYELFTDQDALAAHRDSPAVARAIPELRALTSPGSVQRLVPAIGKGLAQ